LTEDERQVLHFLKQLKILKINSELLENYQRLLYPWVGEGKRGLDLFKMGREGPAFARWGELRRGLVFIPFRDRRSRNGP